MEKYLQDTHEKGLRDVVTHFDIKFYNINYTNIGGKKDLDSHITVLNYTKSYLNNN